MDHSIDFFKDEIRNGFYIPTALKVFWAASLDVLKVIDDICQKHDITYFADWGTFLGAVRHGGFVPWDDDLDICMLRDDYIKFRAVADSELPDHFCIHDYERQEDHWLFLSRVVNNKHICFDEKYLRDHYNFPWLTGVDIFVKDYLYHDPTDEKKRSDEILRILAVADGITDGNLDRQTITSSLDSLKKKYGITLPSLADKRSVSVALYSLAESIMARVPAQDAEMVGQIFPWVLKGSQGEPKAYYEKIVRLPFEDTTIPVPAYYNKVLAQRYGNYIEIHKVWSGHTYPAYEEQRKLFEKQAGQKLPRFSFIPDMLNRPVSDKSGSLKELSKECLAQLKALNKKADQETQEDPRNILSEMQQLSVDLGTLIENVKGEDSPCAKEVVAILEELCEAIFACYQKLSPSTETPDSEPASLDLTTLSKSLEKLELSLEKNIFSRTEALFLPTSPSRWESMKRAYQSACEDDSCDPVVVPLPLFTKDFFGSPMMSDEEIIKATNLDDYDKDLPIRSWTDYDISLHCPETVYIQSPYDGTNPLLSVPGSYYAENIRFFTDHLVYIPIGATAEFGPEDTTDQTVMDYYVTAPGIIYADEVQVQSENIKEQYVNKLTAFASENTRDHWIKKIKADTAPTVITKPDITNSNCKKRLLYCIGLSDMFESEATILESAKNRLDTLSGADDKLIANLCFYPQEFEISETALLSKINDTKAELISYAKERGIETIPLPVNAYSDLQADFDAYYGCNSPLVHEFAMRQKPVMITNYSIS